MARVSQDPPKAKQFPGVSGRRNLATYHHVSQVTRNAREPQESWHTPCNAAGKTARRESGRASGGWLLSLTRTVSYLATSAWSCPLFILEIPQPSTPNRRPLLEERWGEA